MYKLNISSLKLLISLSLSLITSSVYSAINVYLENNYGATLNYKTSTAMPEGQYIGNNVRVFLGDIDFIPELSIRTTGKGSSYVSYYYSLNVFLTDIKMQQAQHQNDDAIIVVEPSRVSWYVVLRWEPKTKKVKPLESIPTKKTEQPIQQPQPIPQQPQPQPKPQEKPQPIPTQPQEKPQMPIPVQKIDIEQIEREEALLELNTSDQRLDAIKNGALGPEFAQKAKEICDANYTQAEKLGKINLCSELKRNVVAPTIRPRQAKRSPATLYYDIHKRPTSADLAPAIDEIKTSINRLHGALARYRSRGEAN